MDSKHNLGAVHLMLLLVSCWFIATTHAQSCVAYTGTNLCTTYTYYSVFCSCGYYYSSSSDCCPCPSGSYCLGTMYYSSCSAGTFSTGGATSCSTCPAGTYSTSYSGSSSCSTCPSGSYCPAGSSSYSSCSAGSYSAQGAGSCTLCPQNSYSSYSASTCTACPAATYNPGAGTTSASCCSSGMVYNGYSCVTCSASSCSCSSFSQSYCTSQQTSNQCVYMGSSCVLRSTASSNCTLITDENVCWSLSPTCGWIKGANSAGCISAQGPQPTNVTLAPIFSYVIAIILYIGLFVVKFFVAGRRGMNLLFVCAIMFITLNAISLIQVAMQNDIQVTLQCSPGGKNTSTVAMTLQGITVIQPPSSTRYSVPSFYPQYCPLKGTPAAPPLQALVLLTGILAPSSLLLTAFGFWHFGFAAFFAWINFGALCIVVAFGYFMTAIANAGGNTACGISNFCYQSYNYYYYYDSGYGFMAMLDKAGWLLVGMMVMGGIMFFTFNTLFIVGVFNKSFRGRWLPKIVAWCGRPEMEAQYVVQANELQQNLINAQMHQANLNLQQAGIVPVVAPIGGGFGGGMYDMREATWSRFTNRLAQMGISFQSISSMDEVSRGKYLEQLGFPTPDVMVLVSMWNEKRYGVAGGGMPPMADQAYGGVPYPGVPLGAPPASPYTTAAYAPATAPLPPTAGYDPYGNPYSPNGNYNPAAVPPAPAPQPVVYQPASPPPPPQQQSVVYQPAAAPPPPPQQPVVYQPAAAPPPPPPQQQQQQQPMVYQQPSTQTQVDAGAPAGYPPYGQTYPAPYSPPPATAAPQQQQQPDYNHNAAQPYNAGMSR